MQRGGEAKAARTWERGRWLNQIHNHSDISDCEQGHSQLTLFPSDQGPALEVMLPLHTHT